MLIILSHADELGLVEILLKTIKNVEALNRYVVKEIYDSAFAVSNGEFANHDKALIKSDKLDAAELIADVFWKQMFHENSFYKLNIFVLGLKKKDLVC